MKRMILIARDAHFQSWQLEYPSTWRGKNGELENLGMARYLLLGRVYKKVGIVSKNGRNYRGKKGVI